MIPNSMIRGELLGYESVFQWKSGGLRVES